MHMFPLFLVVILLAPHHAYAGFDLGPVGNSLFWVGLALWSAVIAWALYTRREKLGKGVFGILRTVFAPHTKTTVVLSSPKYRPYVQTSHVVDSLEEAAESFLTSAKTGFRDAKAATRLGLSILEHDAATVLKAAETQAQTLRKGTTLSERVRNIKRLLSGARQPRSKAKAPSASPQHAPLQRDKERNAPVPSLTLQHHDESHHTRQKVKILSDAHRALIRARNAQHDLPEGGHTKDVGEVEKVPEIIHTPASTPDVVVPKSIPMVEHAQPQQKVVQDGASQSVPQRSEVQHVTVREHPKKEPEYPNVHHASAATTAATGPTKDELVLDTTGPIPRLVLTRKSS